jgi:hypothetical protein
MDIELVIALLAASLVLCGGLRDSAQAVASVDHFSNMKNLTSFGDVSSSVLSNTLSATCTGSATDSGLNWPAGGSTNLSILGMMGRTFSNSRRFCSINILIFDSGGGLLSEISL